MTIYVRNSIVFYKFYYQKKICEFLFEHSIACAKKKGKLYAVPYSSVFISFIESRFNPKLIDFFFFCTLIIISLISFNIIIKELGIRSKMDQFLYPIKDSISLSDRIFPRNALLISISFYLYLSQDQIRTCIENALHFSVLLSFIRYIWMELTKILCDSVNRISIPSLLDQLVGFDE